MKIGVLGAGTMGHGIAQAFAMSGHEVKLYDIEPVSLEKAKKSIEKSIAKIHEKQGEDPNVTGQVVQSIEFVTDIHQLSDSDLIVEAIIEQMAIKKKVFHQLGEICKESTILASNTSGLSVTELGAASGRPDQVVGMHFFNPVPLMKLVEVVKAEETSDETLRFVRETIESIGKEAITVLDSPLFVVNRILVPMLNEAMIVYGEGLASKEDIDRGMMLGTNQPIGPLALADLIGLDTLQFVCETLFTETGDSKYRVPLILKKKVRAGHYGRKSGRGFYSYD
ncbi:3-hydroxyacyl-CoA dehydrogenase family protein [Chryseomicrobium palamuruense]|uniref:3-hydroxyacyl-CoA dehydrogenase family protein n=1 Tax=Chryseomicrobium palamuruense TaxID=682973 RepID=A0ABV8UVY7_9BACL